VEKTEINRQHDHLGGPVLRNRTCALTLADHTDFGLPHTLDPNKRHLKMNNCTVNLEKSINRPKQPWRHQIQDIRSPKGALTPASCTVPSLCANTCIHSTNRSILYNTCSIQKLSNQKNGTSIQSITFWIGVTNKNDMPMDASKGHQLRTQTQARPKQSVSEDSYKYQKSRKNHKGIKVTSWPPNTRYKKAWGAPALTSYTVLYSNRRTDKDFTS